jgi:hypothetical protein
MEAPLLEPQYESPLWESHYGSPSMEAPVWEPQYGSPSMEAPVWEPQYGSPSMGAPVWYLHLRGHIRRAPNSVIFKSTGSWGQRTWLMPGFYCSDTLLPFQGNNKVQSHKPF